MKQLALIWLVLPALLFAQQSPPPIEFNVSSFQVEGDNRLTAAATKQLLSQYIGQHSGLDGLAEAASTLEIAHTEIGHTFHRVQLPPQTMTAGVVVLEVVVFTLGDIRVTGNQHYDDDQILRSLPAIKANQAPNTRRIARSLALANRHPHRQQAVNITQGNQPKTLDAEIRVKDQKPWQLFAGLSNIGTDRSGRTRVTAGAQHGSLLGFDDTATVSYTTAEQNPEDVQQYGFSYNLPLYRWASNLNLFYSRSDVDSGTINSLEISGAGRFAGIHLSHLLLRQNNYSHEVSVGLVDKFFDNNASFIGINLAADVRSRPLSLGYSGQYRTAKAQIGFATSLNINTGGGANSSQSDYRANRAGASNHWQRFNLSGHINYFLDNQWLLRAILDAQHSNEPLISGEQFGLGGINSVRGFDERAVTGDSGMRLSLEAWLPPLALANAPRLLAFVDYGYIDRENALAGEAHSDNIMSVGIGSRWSWQENLNLSVDYGYVTNSAEHLQGTTIDPGHAKWHINLIVRY